MTPEQCQEACNCIDEILSLPEPGPGCVLLDNKSRLDWNIVNSSFKSLKPTEDCILECLFKSWKKYNSLYGASAKPFFDIFSPGWKFQRSHTGGGFHKWHYEQGPEKNSSERFAVWMIYLNTVEEGGQTDFKHQSVSFKPTAGTLIIWPASYTHVHRSNPNLVGSKYIATGWFSYREQEKN